MLNRGAIFISFMGEIPDHDFDFDFLLFLWVYVLYGQKNYHVLILILKFCSKYTPLFQFWRFFFLFCMWRYIAVPFCSQIIIRKFQYISNIEIYIGIEYISNLQYSFD